MGDNKKRISITITPDLLRRLEKVCASRGEPRSALIERILEKNMNAEERFMRHMENPGLRVLYDALVASPEVLRTIAAVAGDSLDAEDAKDVKDQIREQIARGKARVRKEERGQSGLAGEGA